MPSKADLLDTIEKQKIQINTYETRLIDLIRSYKSIQKEKAALQESFSTVIGQEILLTSPRKETEEGKDDATCPSDSESTQSEVEAESSEVADLNRKLKTLQNSLNILNRERDKNEALLKEDRKVLLEEKKKLEVQLESEKTENGILNKELKTKLEDTMNNLALNQTDREKETINGMTMIRELETKLAKERSEKDSIESMLYSSKEKQRTLTVAAKSNELHQRKITDLQNELEKVHRELNKAIQQCQEPPLLKELQIQMKEMQLQYRQTILQEQKRAQLAEVKARELSTFQEDRVTVMEKKLTDLSTNAAKYDKTKQSQQEAIKTLKERVQELSEENLNLTSRESSPVQHEAKCLPEANLATLSQNLILTWERICDFKQKTKHSFDIEDLLVGSEVIHVQCNKDYLTLKNEFENLKDTRNSSKCICGLQDQIHELMNRVRSLTNDANLTQKTHSEQIVSLTKEASSVRRLHEVQLLQLQQEHKAALSNLEQQLSDHCQRSLDTLREREEVISRLSNDIHKMKKDAEGHPRSVAAALLAQVETTSGMEGPLLHHLEEMARKELEVVELRRQKIQFERSLRDVQAASIERQEFLQESVFTLETEVNRLKRNVSREGENLEYLKNVILKYMISPIGPSRYCMLNAISAVLKFSPDEIESVRLYLDTF